MNLNEQYFLVARDARRRVLRALGRYATAEAAGRAGDAAKRVPDYVVLRGDRLTESLTPDDFVALHNALVPRADRATLFPDRDVGLRRLMHAWDRIRGGGFDEPPPEDQPTEAAPAAEETTMDTKETTGAAGEAAAAKQKKARAPKAKAPKAKRAKANGAAKAARASGPREGSVSAMVVDGIRAGKTRDSIVREVCRKFPDSEFVENGNSFFSWYRWNAVRKGWLTKAQADKTAAE